MMARAVTGGWLLVVLMLWPMGLRHRTASAQNQDANTGNDLFRPPANLFQMMYDYKTAPGSGSVPGSKQQIRGHHGFRMVQTR